MSSASHPVRLVPPDPRRCHVIRDTDRSFGRAAARYHEHAHVQRAMAAWLAAWLPDERTGRALELGAGPGVFTAHLVPWAGTLVPTDRSPAMVAAGRSAFSSLPWRPMAAEEVAGGPWDWIFSSSMLQWSTAPVNVLAGWRRSLAPGGRVLAGLFIEETLPELRAVIGADGPVPWRSADEWRGAIAAAGLRLVRDATERRVFTYPSAAALWRSLHGVGAAPERRAGPGQLREWLRAYDARHGMPNGGVAATWTFYRFEAVAAR